MNLDLNDKIVLVCGASMNIGEKIAREFASENAKVVMIARNRKRLNKIFVDIGGEQAGHSYYAVDLKKKNKLRETINKVKKKYKRVDIVVHNIGGSLGVVDSLASKDEYNKVWDYNVGISIEINNMIIPLMLKKKSGRIIHISSIVALNGDLETGSIPYSASKAYLNNYIKSMGRKYAKNKIIICGVMPGAIHSKGKYWDRVKKTKPTQLKTFLKHHQLIGRLGNPEEISSFVIFLSSSKSSFACGSIIPVDGGWL